MKLISLRLRDIGPFEKTTFEFAGYLIGVVGPNGAGKSTLMESLRAAWLGDFRKYANLADFVRDLPGGTKTSSGSIQSVAEHQGVKLTVMRTISVSSRKDGARKGSQRAVLKIEFPDHPAEDVEGVNEVNTRLRAILGEDLALMGQYAFVPQNETSAIVTSDPSERTKALHRLFGLERFERIWGLLGKELESIPELRSVEDVASLHRDRIRIDAEVESDGARVNKLRHDLEAMKIADAEKDVLTWESFHEIREKIVSAEAEVEAAQSVWTSHHGTTILASAENKRISAAVDAAGPVAEKAKLSLNAAEAARRRNQRGVELEAEIARITCSIAGLIAPVEPAEKWNSEEETALAALVSERDVSDRLLKDHAKFVRDGAVLSTCPTCNQSIADIASVVAAHRAKGEKLQQQILPLVERRRALQLAANNYAIAQSGYAGRLAEIERQAESVQREYAGLGPAADPSTYAEPALMVFRVAISERDGLLGALKQAEQHFRVATANELTAEKSLNKAKDARSALQASMSSMAPAIAFLSVERIELARATIKLASDKRVEVARAEQSHKDRILEMERLKLRIQQAEELERQIDRARQTRETLQGARDAFHRDRLPMQLAGRFISAIDRQLQSFLELMRSDFTASLTQVDNEYHFRCFFDDTTEREASSLSGGEAVRFAIGFLLAVNEAMASRLGFLALDEPTAQLDAANIRYFVEVLEHVQRYARNAGVQVFLITHSAELMGSFDQTITLARGEEIAADAA